MCLAVVGAYFVQGVIKRMFSFNLIKYSFSNFSKIDEYMWCFPVFHLDYVWKQLKENNVKGM